MADDSEDSPLRANRNSKRRRANCLMDSDNSDSDSSIDMRRKGKRIFKVAGSDDSSKNDDSVPRASTHKRLFSDSSTSSDSEMESASEGNLVDVSSSAWESDWSSESQDESENIINTIAAPPIESAIPSSSKASAWMSDSSDGQSDKCPICLLSFTKQEVGTPESCDHSFCADCLQEWSRNVNTCPVDRQEFTLILVRKRVDGKVIRQVPVEVRRPSEDDMVEEDPTHCEVCGQCDREDRMLLCDGCDAGYHMECLNPPMEEVPLGQWYCSECVDRNGAVTDEIADDEVYGVREETLRSSGVSSRRRGDQRIIPRTRASERVRATIETHRVNQQRVHVEQFYAEQPSTSSGFESLLEASTSGSRGSASRVSNSRTKRTKTISKKSTSRKSRKRSRRAKQRYELVEFEICQITGEKRPVKRIVKRKSRKAKRKGPRKIVKPKTVKKRLADHLGMCPPRKPGQSLPDVKIKQEPGGIGFQRSQAGIPPLHLFGQRDNLDYFSDNESDIEISSGTGNSSVAVVANRSTLSHIAAAARRTNRQKLRVFDPPPISTNQINLLDSILESQEQWHSRKSKVTVNIDGSLNIQVDKSKASIKENEPVKHNNNNTTDIVSSNTKKVDVNQNVDPKDVSKVPMYPGHGGGNNRAPYNFQNRGGGAYRGSNNYRGSQDYVGYQGSGNTNNNQYGSNRGPDQWGNRSGFSDYSYNHPGPQRPRDVNEYRSRNNTRFPRRPNIPSSSSDDQPHSLALSENLSNLPTPNAQSSVNHQPYKDDSEFDIYSDIETAEQNEDENNSQIVNNITPIMPPVIQNLVTEESCSVITCESEKLNDSETKGDLSNNYDPAEPSPSSDDENVTSDVVRTNSEEANISCEESTNLENEIPSDCTTLVSSDEFNVKDLDNTIDAAKSKIENSLLDDNNSLEKSEQQDSSLENELNIIADIPENNITDVSLTADTAKKLKLDTSIETASKEIEKEVTKNTDNVEDSDEDDCPNFSIYSATSMEIARPTDDILNDPNLPHETEEDLVQLTGDEVEVENQNAHLRNISINNASEPATVDPPNVLSVDPEEESNTKNEAIVSTPSLEIVQESNIEPNTNKKSVVGITLPPAVNDIIQLENVELKKPPPKVLNLTPSTVKSSGRSQRFPPSKKSVLELYDDSDWEEWNNEKTDEEKTLTKPPSTLAGIEKLTESISDVEDERSYTPCLDENKSKTRPPAQDIFASDEEFPQPTMGIGGLDTELISDEENLFADDTNLKHTTETKDKIVDDIEINKSKLDEYEEGEIVERVMKPISKNKSSDDESDSAKKKKSKSSKSDKNAKDKERSKKSEGFKKLNKSGKDRNYRDKDKNDITKNRDRSKTQDKENEKENKNKTKEPKKREKRKDIERYDVRQVVSERPRKQKDKYGRDTSRQRSMSRSRSRSPLGRSKTRRSRSRRNLSRRRSTSRIHKSRSRQRSRSRRRSRSPRHRFSTHSRSRSRSVNRTKIRPKKARNMKRRRSRTRSGSVHRNIPKKVGLSESKQQKYKNRSRSKSINKKNKWNANKRRKRSRSLSKDWSESWSSRSQSPKSPTRGVSPSWTPPMKENAAHNAENLTVILKNKEATKSKKKEKKKKSEKKTKDSSLDKYKKRKRDRSEPQPSKEVFASGDNILVSVSFNKKQSGEDTSSTTSPSKEPLSTKRKHKGDEQDPSKKSKNNKSRDKSSKQSGTKKTRRSRIDTTNSKPVAIIDLDKSPFKELTPSPKAVIVLSDSDKEEERQSLLRRDIMEIGSIQGDSQPQSPTNERDSFMSSTGPKTPPEPQIKFCIPLKPQTKLRSINPLHDTEDDGNEIIEDVQDNMHLPEVVHKGPNTPPEPPASPPSSPDAYDPFEPTKSGSQSPEDQLITQSIDSQKNHTSIDGGLDISHVQSVGLNTNNGDNISREPDSDLVLNSSTVEQVITLLTKKYSKSPERNPIPNTSPHESNSSRANSESGTCAQKPATVQSPDITKSGVTILSNVLLQPKLSESTLVYSSVAPITSTPIVSSMGAPRVNIFNTPAGSIPPRNIATALPQRVVLPTPLKNSPNKSQSRPSPIKSSPIKPMLSKTVISKLPLPGQKQYIPTKKSLKHMRSSGQLNGSDVIDVDMDIESPYSPGSDDYDDLFEPPQMDSNKSSQRNMSQNKHNTKSPGKNKSSDAFDTLFGGSSPVYKNKSSSNKKAYTKTVKYKKTPTKGTKTQVGVKMDDDQLKILEDLPSSAVEMQVKDKFLKKLNRQERVVEEVKLVLKPHYNKKHVTKEQYKDVLRRAVPKICHNKSGEINPQKIQSLIEAYVKKIRQNKKLTKP